LVSDWLGNSRYLVDNTGNGFPQTLRLDVFGNRSLTRGPDPYDATDFQFAGPVGYQTDPETSLLLLTHRHYDTNTGRFLTRDPIGSAGGLKLYAFTVKNPVRFADSGGTNPRVSP
jgi:RHS repeat-associated protein